MPRPIASSQQRGRLSAAVVQFEKYMLLIHGLGTYVGTWIHVVDVFPVPEVTVKPTDQQSATTWVPPATGYGHPAVENVAMLQECEFAPQ
jgi:hypothetical protein